MRRTWSTKSFESKIHINNLFALLFSKLFEETNYVNNHKRPGMRLARQHSLTDF